MRKRTFIVLLALCVLLMPAMAGGSGEKASSDGGKTVIRFVSWQTNHATANEKVAEAYEALHPDVDVQFEYIGDMNSNDYMTTVDIMIMGGEPMDIVMTSGFPQHAQRADSGAYLDLDPYFEADGTTFEDSYNSTFRVNGGVYGIAGEMKYNLVLINKDLLDKAGLPVPSLEWTWDDYKAYAEAMTEGEGASKVYGSFFYTWGNQSLLGVSGVKKGTLYFKDDHTPIFDLPAFSDFLQYRKALEDEGVSTPIADIKALNMNYRDQFFRGQIAMLPMGTFMLSDIGNEKYSPEFVTTFARIPMWNSDDPHYNVADGTFFSIPRTSEHPEAAFDFLRFWTTEGVAIKGMFISNEKGADRMESVNAIVSGFTDKIDLDALSAIMGDPEWVESYPDYCPAFQMEIDTALAEEVELYLLGSQSLDDTVAKLINRSNAIIAEYTE